MIDYYVDPTNGSDTTGTGSQAAPWRTMTWGLSMVAGNGVAGATATVHLLGNTAEKIQVPRHNWAVPNNHGMVIDLGGFTVTPPAQAAIAAVTCETGWYIQNGVLNPGYGMWGIVVDQRSNISFGSGLTINMGQAAGGVLVNASSDAVFYAPVNFSGGSWGYLMQASYASSILYEAPTIGLNGAMPLTGLFRIMRKGNIFTTQAVSFTGTYTYTGPKGLTDDGSQVLGGVTWPTGATAWVTA